MRVTGLLNCGVQIPSLETGRQFYSGFGLSVAENSTGLAVRCDGRDQDQMVLTEGPAKQLHHVAFAVEPGTLPDWQRHLEGMGVTIVDPPGRDWETPPAVWCPLMPEEFLVNLEDKPQ